MHINQPNCPSCIQKLTQCASELSILHEFVSQNHNDAHISWGFRDEASQNQAVADGKSKLYWPNSAHNREDAQGNPQSHAIDYFQLNENGQAQFDKDWYRTLWNEIYDKGFNILWGGHYTHLGDFDHFELNPGEIP